MYPWVVFVHVASVLAFMLAHGVHVSAMWAMRGEPDPERMLTFFNHGPSTTWLRVLLVVVVASGVAAGILGSWWGTAWIWASLAVLAAIWLAMWRYAGEYFGLVEGAANAAIAGRGADPQNAAPLAAYDTARGSWHPIGMSVVGLGGLLIILWLMMFKPF